MVQRITRAPPPRLTNLRSTNGLSLCASSFATLAPWPLRPPPSVSCSRLCSWDRASGRVLGSFLGSFLRLLLLLTLLPAFAPALPFAAPAFLGLAASGSAISSTTLLISSRWVGVGKTGSGSDRSCAGSSLLKAAPSSRTPAPDGSVATTPSGSPSSFQASAASSPSSSLSLSSPAMIASATMPEF